MRALSSKHARLSIINVYKPLISHPQYFPDGIHPDSEGAQIIANITL